MVYAITLAELRRCGRMLLTQPLVSLTVVAALAAGIALSTAGFALRDALLHSELPYAAGPRFVSLSVGLQGDDAASVTRRLRALRDYAQSFEHIGAFASRRFTIAHEDTGVESVSGALLTPRTLPLVEAVPLAGRLLSDGDATRGAERVVLIRESLWFRRYGGSASLIGRHLWIGGHQRTVVGVLPNSFEYPNGGELWLPMDRDSFGDGPGEPAPNLQLVGVLNPGVALDGANDEVAVLLSGLPPTTTGRLLRRYVHRFGFDSDDEHLGTLATAVVAVLVMVQIVLASNVGALLLARTRARAHELDVRAALGASRARLTGHVVAEAVPLVLVAAILGVVIAFSSLRYVRESFEGWPFWFEPVPNPRTLVFVLLLGLLAAAVGALPPALSASRVAGWRATAVGTTFVAGGFGRTGAAILITEVALSVALLSTATTVTRTFRAYSADVPALPTDHVLAVTLGEAPSPQDRERLVAAVRALPGVVAAGVGESLPRLQTLRSTIRVEPLAGAPPMSPRSAPGHAVGQGFLEAIGGTPTRGRRFSAEDFEREDAPVAIVNQSFGVTFFGVLDPIGRRFSAGGTTQDADPTVWREIVGVVPDLGPVIGDPSLSAGFYVPVGTDMRHLAVRTAGDPLTLSKPVQAIVGELTPNLPIEDVRTLRRVADEEGRLLKGVAVGLAAMGSLAMAVSVAGVYALLSFMVTHRTREIAIRSALGASRSQIVRAITARALLYLGLGGASGTALSLWLGSMRHLVLISMAPAGLWLPLTIVVTLMAVGGLACWVPARRAASIPPTEAMSAS